MGSPFGLSRRPSGLPSCTSASSLNGSTSSKEGAYSGRGMVQALPAPSSLPFGGQHFAFAAVSGTVFP